MNHPSEWKRIYHPPSEKYRYKHKGTGVVIVSLFKIGKAMKKPAINFFKQAGKKVAEKGINKASDVVVKKAGDKIRERSGEAKPTQANATKRDRSESAKQNQNSNSI